MIFISIQKVNRDLCPLSGATAFLFCRRQHETPSFLRAGAVTKTACRRRTGWPECARHYNILLSVKRREVSASWQDASLVQTGCLHVLNTIFECSARAWMHKKGAACARQDGASRCLWQNESAPPRLRDGVKRRACGRTVRGLDVLMYLLLPTAERHLRKHYRCRVLCEAAVGIR